MQVLEVNSLNSLQRPAVCALLLRGLVPIERTAERCVHASETGNDAPGHRCQSAAHQKNLRYDPYGLLRILIIVSSCVRTWWTEPERSDDRAGLSALLSLLDDVGDDTLLPTTQ